MGAAQSTSSSLPSKQEILQKTRGGRDIVNQVFDWMVSRTSLRELYELANPEKCKQYIFLTADSLEVLFNKIELEPKEGKKGTIFFQKISDFTQTPKEENQRSQFRKIICLKLAFLYVRIFQVFASLSLSILDVNPEVELKLYDGLRRLEGRDEGVPLFGRQRGGALDPKIPLPSDFEPLRGILNILPGEGTEYFQLGNKKIFIVNTPINVNRTLGIVYKFSKIVDTEKGKQEKPYTLKGYITISRSSPDEMKMYFTSLQDKDKSYDDFPLTFKREIGEGWRESQGRRGIADAIESKFMKIVKGVTEEYAPLERRLEGATSESGVSEGLHTRTLLQAFKQTIPVKAHCISRALQLLSETGIERAVPKEVYSSVCMSKFPLIDNRSLPGVDKDLTSSYGIYALAQLFYDTLKGASPTISDASAEQYKLFLTKMRFIFEEDKASKKDVVSLKQVINRLPKELCTTDKKDHPLKIKNHEVIRQLRSTASKMIQYQIVHTANVVKVLKKLFLLPMDSGKPLQIHPNVRKNGLVEVNKVASEAKELLINYYSNCETMYRLGTETITSIKDKVEAV